MEDIYRSQFRLPYSLYEQLKEAADNSGRSLNAEVVYRLIQSFNEQEMRGDLRDAARHFTAGELAGRLADPKNRDELEELVATLLRLSEKDNSTKK